MIIRHNDYDKVIITVFVCQYANQMTCAQKIWRALTRNAKIRAKGENVCQIKNALLKIIRQNVNARGGFSIVRKKFATTVSRSNQ